MDFSLDDDVIALREAVRGFCARALPPAARGLTPSPDGRAALRAGLADLGLYGLTLPEDDGGLGLGPEAVMVVAQALGEALADDGGWLASAVTAAPLLAGGGAAALRERWLPALREGRVLASLAALEPGARFDTRQVATRARRAPREGRSGWLLDGEKAHVLAGDEAGLFIVLARCEALEADRDGADPRSGCDGASGDSAGRAGREGLTLFAVAADAPGLTRRPYRTVDGRSAAHLTLCGVAVDDDARIGAVGEAAPWVDEAVRRAEAALCAEAAGTLDHLLEMTAEHLRTRRQFGAPLASLQGVQHPVADMAIAREQVLSMACAAALACLPSPGGEGGREGVQDGEMGAPVGSALQDAHHLAARLHAAAKVITVQGSREVALKAIQLHGAMGMTDECAASRYARRLLGVGGWWGDEAHHLARLESLHPLHPRSASQPAGSP